MSLQPAPHVVIVGGGPGGYEAAHVARRLGAEVTLVERNGIGGAAVLTDVVPSKSLIATAEWTTIVDRAADLGVRMPGAPDGLRQHVDLGAVNTRVRALAAAQSSDISSRLRREGVRVLHGEGRLAGPGRVAVRTPGGQDEELDAQVVLIATGATPRVLPTAVPDGERILTWTQLYTLDTLPERLVVVGSGVTGAEFAGAYSALGSDVVLVSSRDQLLPSHDADAAALIEEVLTQRGMTVMSKTRATRVTRVGDQVEVELADGRTVTGSHVLMAVGAEPSTGDLGLAEAGVRLGPAGHVLVDRVSRTSAPGVYAAGDCTGVLPLASVAAQQGRIAMAHALGDAVRPLDLETIPATVFTTPEIATVGPSEAELRERGWLYSVGMLPLARNPRAKMLGVHDGFVKVFAHATSGTVLGAVIVGPRAGEHIYPLSIAVAHRLTVDQLAGTSTVYPSLSGTVAEVARSMRRTVHRAQ